MRGKDWKLLCEQEGLEFLKSEGKYLYFKVEGFTFKSTKIEFPPKYINPSKCLDMTGYAVYKFKSIHGDKYDYSKFQYLNNSEKSIVICGKHGEFLTSYNIHSAGHGCKSCATGVRNQKVSKIKKSVWLERFRITHGSCYDYSKSKIDGCLEKIEIVCARHGSFYQQPYAHASGQGCPICSARFDTYSRSSYMLACPEGSNLYVFKFKSESEEFYKIGISKDYTRRLKSLIKESGYSISVEYVKFSENSGLIWSLEKYLHGLYFKSRYEPNNHFSGMTECFTNLCVDQIEMEVENNLERLIW